MCDLRILDGPAGAGGYFRKPRSVRKPHVPWPLPEPRQRLVSQRPWQASRLQLPMLGKMGRSRRHAPIIKRLKDRGRFSVFACFYRKSPLKDRGRFSVFACFYRKSHQRQGTVLCLCSSLQKIVPALIIIFGFCERQTENRPLSSSHILLFYVLFAVFAVPSIEGTLFTL